MKSAQFSTKPLFFIFEVLLILCVPCFSLFAGIMTVNEIDVLPLAKQFVNPEWIPTDWYLNQDPGYRELFQSIFGRIIDKVGFLYGPIIGRLICWGLTSIGLVLIAKKLRLNIFLLLLAIFLFIDPGHTRSLINKILSFLNVPNFRLFYLMVITLAIIISIFLLIKSQPKSRIGYFLLLSSFGLFLLGTNSGQSLVAGEAIIADLQAKTIAYSFVILAIAGFLWRYYKLMALAFGLATSFHVLVGGYAFFSSIISILLLPKNYRLSKSKLIVILLIYVVASGFAIQPVFKQLLTSAPQSDISYSYIYVFLRLPHHLYPASWPQGWWLNLVTYILMLMISYWVIKLNINKSTSSQDILLSTSSLLTLTLIALIPFIIGLLITPFDADGKFLQYYPFRFGDIILPLNACIIFALAVDQTFVGKWQRFSMLTFCTVIIIWNINIKFIGLQNNLKTLRQSPVANNQIANNQTVNMYNWIKINTLKEEIFITSPSDLNDFTWMTERATIAKLKFLPQQKKLVLDWNSRLKDLNGGSVFWPTVIDSNYNIWQDVGKPLAKNYNQLTSEQVLDILKKYKAKYFITKTQHQLNLPIVYQNENYIIYSVNDLLGLWEV